MYNFFVCRLSLASFSFYQIVSISAMRIVEAGEGLGHWVDRVPDYLQ